MIFNYVLGRIQVNIIKQIEDLLRSRIPRPIEHRQSSYIHAAVLVPLFKDDTEYRVLFTERTNKVEHHKGQISFPGGAVDKDDQSWEETALREAQEEIGLLKKDVRVLGQIDDVLTTVSDFIIHSFVGQMPYPYDFTLNREEVEKIITIPLRAFLGDHMLYKRDRAEFEDFTYEGTSYYYNGIIIWGATARIMENFMDILGGRLGLPSEGE